MWALAVIAAFSVLLVGCNAQTQYVEPGSVQCLSTEIDFSLSTDPAQSDLYRETLLQVTLYTDGKTVTQFTPGSAPVKIPYAEFQIQATTAYGPNKRPRMYFVNQQFRAEPISGGPRNYTFSITCTIQAAYVDQSVFNTTDDGHGDHGGGTVVPTDHVEAKVSGLRPDRTVTLGDPLTYIVDLTDNVYAGLLPVTCRYYNPSNTAQSINFVTNNCPEQFPEDPEGYFTPMRSTTPNTYELSFRAFSFTQDLNSIVGIECDMLLCIDQNHADCSKGCWGATTIAPATMTTAATTETPSTAAATTETTTTAAGTTETTTTQAATESTTVTTEAPTTTTTEAASTTTTEASTTETTTSGNQPRARRFVIRFDTAPIVQKQNSLQDDPKSVTINDKTLFTVNQGPQKEAICANNELLTALYGIIGGLALLVVVLLLTLIYMLCIGRRRKVEQETMYPMIPDGPRHAY